MACPIGVHGVTIAMQLKEFHMQMNQVNESLARIEQCTDQAVAAVRQAGQQAPDDLRQCVDQMHAQARDVRSLAKQSADEAQLTSRVDQLEQTGDRAKQACQRAGSALDPQLQSAVVQAHDAISNLKKQMH